MATTYVIRTNNVAHETTYTSKVRAIKEAELISEAAEIRNAGDVITVSTEKTNKIVFEYVNAIDFSRADAPVVESDETACVGFVECPCKDCRNRRLNANEAHPNHTPNTSAYCEPCRRATAESVVEIQGEYIEPEDAFASMGRQLYEARMADGGCVGLCGLGQGCAHCDETYGTLEPETTTQTVTVIPPVDPDSIRAEIQEAEYLPLVTDSIPALAVMADWERELMETGSLPVVPSPVKCQDCGTREATIFETDAPMCLPCLNKPFVIIPGVHALDLGVGPFVAYNRFVGIRESEETPGSLFTFGLATAISAHPGMSGTGHTNLPCEFGDVITVRTSLGDARYVITDNRHGVNGEGSRKGDPLLVPYGTDDVRCYVCEVYGDKALQGQNIDGEWVCGYCVANERTPGMLNSHSLSFYVETENCGVKYECGNCKSIDSRGNFAEFTCESAESPEFVEGDAVRVVNVPSLPDATGTYSHKGKSAHGITLDNGESILVKFGHLELVDAGFIETMVTKEYELSVIVDDSTGASVSLGWVVLEMNSAQCMDWDRVAEAYGAAHGTGTPRHGWASIIRVHDVCDV